MSREAAHVEGAGGEAIQATAGLGLDPVTAGVGRRFGRPAQAGTIWYLAAGCRQ